MARGIPQLRKGMAAVAASVFVLFIALPFSILRAQGEGVRPSCFCNDLRSNASTWRIFLCAKDPATWKALPVGGWGELTIRRPSGKSSFKGHGLKPTTEYALVRYGGEPPYGNVLACGRTDGRGEFRTAGVWSVWQGKFWLLLGSDLREKCADLPPGALTTLKAWHPADYLFESETL